VLRPLSFDGRWHDFRRPGKYITIGRREAEKHLDEIKALVNRKEPTYETSIAHHSLAPLPRETVRRLQAEKLRLYLRRCRCAFSAHYRELFQRYSIRPDSIRSVDDLEQIPFSSKADLVNSPENPQKAKDFLLVPEARVLSRRFSTIARALLHGRESVRQQFELEFRPVFMTSTTGRAADPVPFLYTRHDLGNLAITGNRIMEVCDAKHDFRLLNMFPYAPHLAFWQTHYASTEFGVFTVGTGGGKVMGTEATCG
jgi:phenylacetate-coenzyme A ligase PaaK-like adenylate-forming protein